MNCLFIDPSGDAYKETACPECKKLFLAKVNHFFFSKREDIRAKQLEKEKSKGNVIIDRLDLTGNCDCGFEPDYENEL